MHPAVITTKCFRYVNGKAAIFHNYVFGERYKYKYMNMRYERALSRILIAGVLLLGVNSVYAGEWRSSASLYFWLPSIDGSGNLDVPPDDGSGEEPLPVDPAQVLDSLDLVLMGSFEVRYDKYLFFADIAYLDLSNTKSVNILNTSRDVAVGFEG